MSLRRPGLWAAGAGALAALGHAPFSLAPVSLVGFAGLIWLVAVQTRSPWGAARIAWVAGTIYFAVSLHWIVEPFLVDVARHGWMAPFALVLMAGGLALFWGGAGYLAGYLGAARLSRGMAFAAALALAELARGYVLSGFPWALPGYIWIDSILSLFAADVGPYGLTAVTLLFTALPVVWRRWWIGAVPLAAIGALSMVEAPPSAGSSSLGTVRLVQPNAPQDEKWDPEKAHVFVERQIGFTEAPKDGVDLIVWPETALPYRLDRATPVLQRMAGGADGVPVIFGINRSEDARNFNALVSIDATGAPTEIYDKVRLVPFGEFIPFGKLAELVGLRSFAAQDGYGFSPGAEVRAIDTPLGQALPLICYEAIFPQHIRALDARPDYLLQITNDAWFGVFSGPFQHLDQARFRAIEQGLPLVRVANTGVSAVIDARGHVIAQLELNEPGYLDVVVPQGHAATLYSRVGDSPVLVLLSFLLAALARHRWRNAIAMRREAG